MDFAIPGDLASLTGGYGYNRRLIAGLAARGHDVRVLALPVCFPEVSTQALERAQDVLRTARAPLLVDSLALCALPPDITARLPHPRIALVHHPLGLDGGLDPALAARLIDNERKVLALCDHILVTSAMTAASLIADFGVEAARISVAEPGTDARLRARGSGRPPQQGPLLVAAGSVVPRKGHDVLVAAMARLAPA
ncbi:MAG: glycosyltransferase, partial [Hyphomicrobiales bacterium]|nr:glycosyltransferase [Hyphomicrobiales bacterium]